MDVNDIIYAHEGDTLELLEYFNHVLLEEYGLLSKVKYKLPFYYGKSWICYLNPKRNLGVELAFTRGNELSNIQGVLENKGRKQVYSLTYTSVKSIDKNVLDEILLEAISLDESVPYASKRSKKS